MLSPREKKKIEKQCEDYKNKCGVEAAFGDLEMRLRRGTCTLAEYQYARMYMSRWRT